MADTEERILGLRRELAGLIDERDAGSEDRVRDHLGVALVALDNARAALEGESE